MSNSEVSLAASTNRQTTLPMRMERPDSVEPGDDDSRIMRTARNPPSTSNAKPADKDTFLIAMCVFYHKSASLETTSRLMASALQPPFSCLLLFFVANITPNSNAQTGLLQRFCGVCPQGFPKGFLLSSPVLCGQHHPQQQRANRPFTTVLRGLSPKVHDAPILAAATTIRTKPMIDHTSGICPKNAKPRMAVKIMLE